MSTLLGVLALVVHTALIAMAAPLLWGAIDSLAARFAGRGGPPVLQAWRDTVRLLRKQPMRAENASVAMRAAPVTVLSLAAVCGLLIPSFTLGMATAPAADILSIAVLLMLGRTVQTLAAIDAGTGPSGVGATEGTRLALASEPALLLAFAALAYGAGDGNLDLILRSARDGGLASGPAAAVAAGALALLAWADAARPLPDADFSARDLAMLRLASQLRLVAWIDLVGALAVPLSLASADAGPVTWGIGLVGWGIRVMFAALALAGARVRLSPGRAPAVLMLALALSGVAAALSMMTEGAT